MDSADLVVVDDIFGPISIIGRQLSPRKGSSREDEVDSYPWLDTPDESDVGEEEDLADGRTRVRSDGLSFKEKKKKRRHHCKWKDMSHLDDSASGLNSIGEEIGVVKDIISDDVEVEEVTADGGKKLRLVRLSSGEEAREKLPTGGIRQSIVDKQTGGISQDSSVIPLNLPPVLENAQAEAEFRTSRRKSKRKSSRPTMRCERCDYSTTSRRKLSRHLAVAHDEGDAEVAPASFSCHSCDFSTSKERRLRRHLQRVHGSVEAQLGAR